MEARSMKQNSLFLFGLAALFCLAACANDPVIPEPALKLTRFVFDRAHNPEFPADVEGLIDHASRTILVRLEVDDVTALMPTIEAAGMAQYEPEGDQDFTDEVFYTMYSKDGYSSIGYKVLALPGGDGYDVALARQLLEIGYADGESAITVKTAVQLANSWTNGCAIAWAYDSPNISIDNITGTVTRPSYMEGDLPVVLTATITKGEISVDKIFSIIILRNDMDDAYRVWADLEALTVGYTIGSGDSAAGVTTNLILIAEGTIYGSAITWESSSTNVVIANGSGKVARPPYGNGNLPVTLRATATLTSGSASREYAITITRDLSDREKAQADLDALTIGYVPGDSAAGVTQSVTLRATGAKYGTEFVYESLGPLWLSAAGIVTRPDYRDGDKTVTIRVLAVYKSSGQLTKDFTLTITKKDITDRERAEYDVEAIIIRYASGESANGVTQNITLPVAGTIYQSTIAWSANLPNISSTGIVERPPYNTGNKTVTLTATATKNGQNSTPKPFPITVIQDISDSEKATMDASALSIGYASGDSASRITQNLTLATLGAYYSSTVTWVANDYITSAGVVTRPSYLVGNQTVSLTAHVAKNGQNAAPKTFSNLIVIRNIPVSDNEKILADMNNLSIGFAAGDSEASVTKNLTFITAVTNAGVTVSWAADKPAVISASGIVTQPEVGSPEETVVITATIRSGGVSDAKIFPAVTVKTKVPMPLVFTNSDFEADAPVGSGVSLTYESVNPFGGTRSLRVNSNGNLSSNGNLFVVPKASCNAKGSYTKVVFWIRGEGRGISVRMFGESAYWNLSSFSSPITRSVGISASYGGTFNLANWTKVTLSLTSAHTAANYDFQFRGGSGYSYNFLLDDIIFE
jgi:hypothetical protein